MDGDLFLTYIREVLGPELRLGDLVICDNLASHKVKGVEDAIAARGAQLQYLPAYRPDLNPIEMVFAKLKALLRQAAARTWDQLLEATAQALTPSRPAMSKLSSTRPVCDRLNGKCSPRSSNRPHLQPD